MNHANIPYQTTDWDSIPRSENGEKLLIIDGDFPASRKTEANPEGEKK